METTRRDGCAEDGSTDTGRARVIGGGANAAKWWTHWGSVDVEIGRSTYVLEEGGSLLASDSVLQDDGGWCVFAAPRSMRKVLETAVFLRIPCCAQKKRAGTCVPAQPFRLSPPETVDPMNAILMSC